MSDVNFILTYETEQILRKAPKPHTDNFMVIEPFKAIMDKDLQEQFNILIKDFSEAIGFPSRPSDRKGFIDNVKSIVLGFIACISKNQWLGVYGGRDFYTNPDMTFNLSYTYTRQILEFLTYDIKAIEFVPGALDRSNTSSKGKTRINKYWPTESFVADLMPFIYCVELPFTGSFVCINYKEGNKKTRQCRLRDKAFKQDRDNLKIINNYLMKQLYPIKSPIKRIYTNDIEHGGRLYGAFQGIPANRVKLRQTLMINASKMMEVDFKANHLTMAIILHEKEYPDSDDPLKLIAKAMPGYEFNEIRGLLKGFVVRLINGSSESNFKRSFNRMLDIERYENCIDESILFDFEFAFEDLLTVFKNSFPNIPLYEKLGNKLQKLEGDILMQVLLEGVSKDIPILPLHDAALCEERHVEEVKGMMKRHWSNVLETEHQPFVEVKS
jgi:hypothetical protein